MPNWCSNNVVVEGDKKRVALLRSFIQKLIPIQNRTGNGQRHMLSKIDDYMFDIYISDDIQESDTTLCFDFSFQSRWSPINRSLFEMAILHKVSMHCCFEESGNFSYGEFKVEYNEEFQEITVSKKELTDEEYEACMVDNEDPDQEKDDADYEKESENLDHALEEKDFEIKLHFHISEYEEHFIDQI